MITKSLTQLLSGFRAATNHDVNDVADALVTDWINEGIRELWQVLTPICRDEFTLLSGNTVLVSPASTVALLTAIGANFLAIRGVDKAVDVNANQWVKLKPWRFPARGRYSVLGYHITGTTCRLEPSIAAAGTYRFWYIPIPVDLPAGTPATTIDLPYGGDTYAIQRAAALSRGRLEEDPSGHLALQASSLLLAQRYMAQHNQGDQETIVDVSGDYDTDMWDW